VEVMAGELTLASLFRGEADRQAAFKQLLEAHQQRVLRTAYRLLGRMDDAQDVAQEVFLRLLRNLDRIEGQPQAWLYRVTVNICNDHYRRRAPVLELLERADPAPDPERTLALGERKRLLEDALRKLPERERAAVVLRDIEGLGTREVAQILGIEEVTVRSHISSARVKLAKHVRKHR
jgi:RNA polymerase sigma-70 factor (ECF subfamily)